MERKFRQEQSEGLGRARLTWHCKYSPYRMWEYWAHWEYWVRILNSYSRFWRNQLSSLGSPVVSTRRRPIALKMTPVDLPYTSMGSTAIGSNLCASGKAVIPSGRDTSPLSNPGGFRTNFRPDLDSKGSGNAKAPRVL